MTIFESEKAYKLQIKLQAKNELLLYNLKIHLANKMDINKNNLNYLREYSEWTEIHHNLKKPVKLKLTETAFEY